MPGMPEPEKSRPQPKPKRGWFRRVLRAALWVALFAAIFHRPLFHLCAPPVARLILARQHLRVDFRTAGSIFTNLTVEGLRITPLGDAPNPVRKITIERLQFHHSLPMLMRYGPGEFLRSYEMKNAHMDFVAVPSKDRGERRRKRAIAQQLNDILAQPAAYADRVRVENFNLTVTAPGAVTRIGRLDLLLDPEQPGHLRIARLETPRMPVWENLASATSYTGRNFYLKELQLAPELVIEEANFDASRRAQHRGGMMLKLRAFGGTAQVSLAGTQLDKKGENLAKSYDTTLKVDAADISIEAAAAYFKAPKPPAAKLASLALRFTGEPEKPRTWKGGIAARIEAIRAGALKVDAFDLGATFLGGVAQVQTANVSAGANAVAIEAKVALPESVNDFPSSDVDATLNIVAPDLPALTAMLPEPLSGSVNGGGTVAMRDGRLDATLALNGEKIANKNLALGSGKISLRGSKVLNTPALAQLDAQAQAELAELRLGTFQIDSAVLDGAMKGGLITLKTAGVRRAGNALTASGTYRLPEDRKSYANAPVDAQFTIQAPKLEAFGIGTKGSVLAGRLDGRGSVKRVAGVLAGDVQLDGGGFEFGGFEAEKLAAKVQVADNVASVEQLALQINATDQIAVVGKVGVAQPFTYEGALVTGVRDLANLQPLLAVFGVKEPLAGALDLEAQGSGAIRPAAHEGKLSLALGKARYGKTDITELKLAGIYGPAFAESTEFRVVTGPTSLAGAIEWREKKLKVRDLDLRQAGATVLTGYAAIPFDPANKEQPIALDQRIAANITATNLDLDNLLGSFGQKSPLSGKMTANLVTGGTLLAPLGHLKVAGRGLKAKVIPQFEPSDLDLNLHYSNRELTLAAAIKQPQIQPLTVKGRVPLDLEATVKNKKLDPNLPIDLTVKLLPSSLAFVPKLAPQVRRIDGTAAIDVHVGGTVGKPVIKGSANVALKSARMVNESVPSIGAFEAGLVFANDTLTLQRFRGELGGGTFSLAGTVKVADPKDPIFDLRLQTDEVLVKRNDSITVRADADLKVTGPLHAGVASGTVFIVHSRFFKDIDILPIGLPGRAPPPAPKTAPRGGPAVVSFPNPPWRDWTFDIALKTREDDPFLIRGNLANGAVSANLKFGGTGLAPWLDGNVRVEKFTASLPFSTLEVTRGFVYYKKDEPFQAKLDLQAESKLSDYTVGAYIYGPPSEPTIQFTSEPPLPHGDIVSLLATGTTTKELGGSAEVLASRAAMLAVQSIYRKVFKPKAAAPPEEAQKQNAESLRERFQLELGSVDNRGQQEVTARFKIDDRFYIIGDLATEGRFTGQLKYLIRFR